MSLKEKALKCAILDISSAIDRQQANIRFKKWDVFHENFEFKKAIAEKQRKFKKIKR